MSTSASENGVYDDTVVGANKRYLRELEAKVYSNGNQYVKDLKKELVSKAPLLRELSRILANLRNTEELAKRSSDLNDQIKYFSDMCFWTQELEKLRPKLIAHLDELDRLWEDLTNFEQKNGETHVHN